MAIELPPFSKIYKQREGVDKFFYDKLVEVVEVVNALTEAKTSKVNLSVKDDNAEGVAGAQVTLTSGGNTSLRGIQVLLEEHQSIRFLMEYIQ